MKWLAVLLAWWREHSMISLVITGGALAGAIPKYVELGSRGFEWVRGRRLKTLARHIPGENDWERVQNVRFGFAFSYPRAWVRKTSDNTDGHLVTHPIIPEIEIRGWGHHVVVCRAHTDRATVSRSPSMWSASARQALQLFTGPPNRSKPTVMNSCSRWFRSGRKSDAWRTGTLPGESLFQV